MRFYRQFSKQKANEHKKEELNARASLEVATSQLHDDIYNEKIQRKINHFKRKVEEIETQKTIDATIRGRIKWQNVGDKCFTKFFQTVR